jgi:hypothetical protein
MLATLSAAFDLCKENAQARWFQTRKEMRKMLPRIGTLLIILLLLAPFAAAQKRVKVDPEAKYLLLSTMKTSTMGKELDEVAAEGFRIVASSASCGQMEMVIFLERAARPPDTYQYRLLATTRTSTMEKELNEAAKEGFRLMPRTIIVKENFLTKEVVAVLERVPKSEKHYEYKLLATNLTSTLQKEVMQSEAEGFILVGMVSRGENMVIMEKEAGIPVSRR